MVGYDGDSSTQRAAERLILDGLERVVGCQLRPARLTLPGGAHVDVDGVGLDGLMLVEVFAHQGPLRAGQRHKIATDALKLITIARAKAPRPRLVLALAEPRLAEWAEGESWLAAALSSWKVEVMVVNLDERVRSEIAAAQRRQVMVAPTMAAGQGAQVVVASDSASTPPVAKHRDVPLAEL